MSQESSHYNKLYAEHEIVFGGGKPQDVVVDVLTHRQAGTVLEIGAGEGRNALFLAQKGFDVTAQDMSRVGIEKINKRAAEVGIPIRTAVGDARTLDWARSYDVITTTFVLHHMQRDEALELIKHMQEHTTPGGLHAITVFTKNGSFFNEHPDTTNFYPAENELRDLYAGWEILKYHETAGPAFVKNPDGSPRINVGAHLLARKPA